MSFSDLTLPPDWRDEPLERALTPEKPAWKIMIRDVRSASLPLIGNHKFRATPIRGHYIRIAWTPETAQAVVDACRAAMVKGRCVKITQREARYLMNIVKQDRANSTTSRKANFRKRGRRK
jgi:hypothetical protein